MYDHLTLRVKDIARSRKFYESALKPLGITMKSSDDEGAGFGNDEIDFWIVAGTPVSHAVHIAFRSESRDTVKAFYTAAMEAGGKDNGGPGLRSAYSATYYAAFVYDPDGNNIEAVCHKSK